LIFASGNINFGVSSTDKIGTRSNSMEVELVKGDDEAHSDFYMRKTHANKFETPLFKRLTPRKNTVQCCSDPSHSA
jgi:hypothetical protein